MTFNYKSVTITRKDGCATITFNQPMLKHDKNNAPPKPGRQRELGIALDELRFDNDIRVIVITGKKDIFCLVGTNHPHFHGHVPHNAWDHLQQLQHTFQQIVEIEKPVIAKVNGHVNGFGSSLVFACDFIVANEKALFWDHHLGMGDGNPPAGREIGRAHV